jgi:hypothetical protein
MNRDDLVPKQNSSMSMFDSDVAIRDVKYIHTAA